MNSDNTLNPLELTEEEIEAVLAYIGNWHTSINLLCNMNASSYDATHKDWYWPKNKEEFTRVIDNFVNLYSAMLKLDEPSIRPVFYRGSNLKQSSLQTNYFRSTSKVHDIALSFTGYNRGEIALYHVPENVPILDVEVFKHDYSVEEMNPKNEVEFIISPFVKAYSRPNGITPSNDHQNTITVSKVEIEEVSPEELEQLRGEVIDGYESFFQDIKDETYSQQKVDYYQEEMNILNRNSSIASENGSLGDTQKLISEHKKQRDALYDRNKLFSNKVTRLIHGLCKQKEIEISKLKAEKAKQDEARKLQEQERKEKEHKTALYKGLHEQYDKAISQFEQLSSSINTNATNFSNMVNTLQQTASTLGTFYDSSEPIELQQLYQEIKAKIDKKIAELRDANSFVDKEETSVNSEWDILNGYGTTIEEINRLLPPLKHVMADYQATSENSIKKDLYIKVFYSLRSAKYYHYQNQLEALKSERPGLFDLFNGKAALRNEQIRELELKMEYESYATPKEQSKYSIHDILSDIYYTFDAELHQDPTPEMQSTIDAINSKYHETQRDRNGNVISRPFSREQLVQDRYNQLVQSNMIAIIPEPTGIASLFANIAKAKAYKSRNEILESKVNQARQTYSIKAGTPNNQPPHSSAFYNYRNALMDIYNQIDSIDSDSRPKVKIPTKEDLQTSLKKGDTLELWAPQ